MRKKIFILSIIACILSVHCGLMCFAEDYKVTDIPSFKNETERLNLSPTTSDDLEILSEYLLDYDVAKYIDPSVEEGFSTKEQVLEFLALENKDQYNEALEFTIKLKDSNIPIGKVDVMICRRDNGNFAMFGYWLGKDFHKKGYAREACYYIFNKVLNASDVKSIYIACESKNVASSRLATDILTYLQNNNKDFNLNRIQNSLQCEKESGEVIEMQEFILSK